MLANKTPDGTTIDGGRGGVCNTKMGGGQDVAANEAASVLDIPGDLASSRQTYSTKENR